MTSHFCNNCLIRRLLNRDVIAGGRRPSQHIKIFLEVFPERRTLRKYVASSTLACKVFEQCYLQVYM